MNVSTHATSPLQTLAAVLGVVLLFGVLGASPAAAQTTIEFNTNDQGIQPDETFTVPVTVNNLDQIASENDFSNFDFEVDFSGVNATLDNVSFNNTLTNDAGMLATNDVRTDDATISAAGTTPLEDVASGGSGVIARLEFTADASGGSGTVDLKNFNITDPLQVGDANADFDVTVAQNKVSLENVTVNQTGASDQTVVVDVTTSSLDGLDIQSFDLGIDFNSSVVTPMSDPIIKNGNASNFSFTDNVSGGTLSISSVTTSPGTALSGDGLLFQIEFNVEGTGTSNLPFSNVAFRDGNNNVENFAGVSGGITVNVDQAPTFGTPVSSPQSTQEDQAASFNFTVTDSETANENLSLSKSSSNGTLVPDDNISLTGPDATGAGTIDITPAADENGSADITITATDGSGNTATNTFTLNVTAVDDPPAAEDDSYTMDEDGTLRVSAPGILGNDTHPDDQSLTLSAVPVNDPSNGTVNLSTDGSFRYTPESGFAGTDQFVYQISDGDSTDTGTVTINVEAIEVTISGTVSYPGEGDSGLTDGRSLSGVPVEVSAVSADRTAMDTTDSDGTFSVTVRTGEYTVQALPEGDVPSGEINATDANRTIGAYLGTRPFAGDFQAEVADVNDSGSANATDALKMALFFNDPAGTTFEAGDWATTSPTADVSGGTDASVSVLAAAYGDADLSGADQNSGSAVATNAGSASPSAALEGESDLRGVEMGQTFEVPVRLESGATLGSYSLQVDFPADKVSFEGVAETDRNVMSTAENGTVRLSWFDQSGEQPMKLGSGASLVTLRFSATEGVEKGAAVTPKVTAGELAGPDAEPLASAQVSVESVEIGSVLPDEFALNGSYPNPVSGGQATVEMDLPNRAAVTVEVYNTLGQRVQTIEQSMAAGTGQTLQVDGSRLASGQYFYRVKADLGDSTAEETGRITVVR